MMNRNKYEELERKRRDMEWRDRLTVGFIILAAVVLVALTVQGVGF